MGEFGKKHLTVTLQGPLAELPPSLADRLVLSADGLLLGYDYDTRAERTGIARLLADLSAQGIAVRDVSTKESSLEDIFLSLVDGAAEGKA